MEKRSQKRAGVGRDMAEEVPWCEDPWLITEVSVPLFQPRERNIHQREWLDGD